VEGFESFSAALLLRITEHVQSDTVGDMLLRAHPIHGLLHFAVATVAALHGLGGGRKQFVVEKRQGLVQVRRLECNFSITLGKQSVIQQLLQSSGIYGL